MLERYRRLEQLQSDMLHAVDAFVEYPPPTPMERVKRGSADWHALRRQATNEWRAETVRTRNRDRNPKRIARTLGLDGQRLENGWTWAQVVSRHQYNYAEALEYWEEERQQERERNKRAEGKVRLRGIDKQRLQSGYTWNEVLASYGGRYGLALEYWERARQQEHDDEEAKNRARRMGIDGQKLHQSGYTWDELVEWYGGSHSKALEYWEQTSQQAAYPYSHNTSTSHYTPPSPPIEETIDIYESRADLNREERIDRALLWCEGHIAWEVWHNGMRDH